MYVHSLLSLGAVAQFELYLLILAERFETVGEDPGKVYENLFSIFACNESVAFFAIEPFYLANHNKNILVRNRSKVTQNILIHKTFGLFFSSAGQKIGRNHAPPDRFASAAPPRFAMHD